MTAGRIVELIEKSSSVGVYFGQTIHAAIEGVEWSGLRPKLQSNVQIMPVAGEITSYIKLGSSSTALANKLHELVNGNSVPNQFSLSSVPFWIGLEGESEERSKKRRWLREWVEQFQGYKGVFGSPGEGGAVDRLDSLITSFGRANHPLSAASGELGDSAQQRITALAEAEIGGVLLPRDGLKRSELAALEDLSNAMFGLRLQQIEDLAKRASDPRRAEDDQIPGICVVGIGENKAAPLLAILERGLCNELMIDEELAVALQGLIRKKYE